MEPDIFDDENEVVAAAAEPCIACEGTGVSSSGRECIPCNGTGRKQQCPE